MDPDGTEQFFPLFLIDQIDRKYSRKRVLKVTDRKAKDCRNASPLLLQKPYRKQKEEQGKQGMLPDSQLVSVRCSGKHQQDQYVKNKPVRFS